MVCNACGTVIIVGPSASSDYFCYCANKACMNHAGEHVLDSEATTFETRDEIYRETTGVVQ